MNIKKNQMRETMKNTLTNLSDSLRYQYTSAIIDRLMRLAVWRKAKTVGITMSTAVEIETGQIINKANQQGKKVAVPKSDVTLKTLNFREIRSREEVEIGFAGIREPIQGKTSPVSTDEIDLLIVPGFVFNEKGYRIGFGGGFYDRYLATFTNATVALAFELQIVDDIPVESFDQSVDTIVTNDRVIRVKGE